MKVYISLLFFLNIIFLFSQSTDTLLSPAVDSKIITNNTIPQNLLSSNIKILETYDNVQGSPYISNYAGVGKNIPLGKVYDQQLKLIGTAFIIYNAYTDEMEISAIEDSINFYRFKKQSNSYYIKLYNKLYRAYVSDYQLNYFVILSANDRQKCTLLRKEKVLFIKSNEQNISLVKEEPSSFRRIKDSYYLKINDLVYKIPSGKKNFYTLFKEKSALIKSYVKQNNLKISSEEDLRSIVDYYNTSKLRKHLKFPLRCFI